MALCLIVTEQAAADLSTDASDNSERLLQLLSLVNLEFQMIVPAKIFFYFLGTVNKPSLIAWWGIAFTKSLKAIPGCNSPVNLTKTDSGIVKASYL